MLKIVPPVWFISFLLLGLAVHFLVPTARVFHFALPWLGALLFVASFGFTLYASSLFKKENTEILPTSPTNRVLITYGPYKFTRNPMYLGMVGTLLGVGLMVGTLPAYLIALAQFLVLNFVHIPFEEAKLVRIFGEQYLAYKKKVRRWI